DKIRFYLKNDELRSKIARAGYEKIFSSGYTYSELVKDIEEKISLQPNSTPSKI
ncbi:MAG TPA: glycosyltransferase family 1 protein, partial [Flavobacteriales bacterium]|nr:glycosyltransferase family 1 protein [Flavobacteriales bacterium]